MVVTCGEMLQALETESRLRFTPIIYTDYLRTQHMNLLYASLRVGHLLDSYEFAGMKKESCK